MAKKKNESQESKPQQTFVSDQKDPDQSPPAGEQPQGDQSQGDAPEQVGTALPAAGSDQANDAALNPPFGEDGQGQNAPAESTRVQRESDGYLVPEDYPASQPPIPFPDDATTPTTREDGHGNDGDADREDEEDDESATLAPIDNQDLSHDEAQWLADQQLSLSPSTLVIDDAPPAPATQGFDDAYLPTAPLENPSLAGTDFAKKLDAIDRTRREAPVDLTDPYAGRPPHLIPGYVPQQPDWKKFIDDPDHRFTVKELNDLARNAKAHKDFAYALESHMKFLAYPDTDPKDREFITQAYRGLSEYAQRYKK